MYKLSISSETFKELSHHTVPYICDNNGFAGNLLSEPLLHNLHYCDVSLNTFRRVFLKYHKNHGRGMSSHVVKESTIRDIRDCHRLTMYIGKLFDLESTFLGCDVCQAGSKQVQVIMTLEDSVYRILREGH